MTLQPGAPGSGQTDVLLPGQWTGSPRPIAFSILLIHLILSPLLFSRSTAESFEFPKVTLLVSTALVATGLLLSSTLAMAGITSAPLRARAGSKPLVSAEHSSWFRSLADPILRGFFLIALSAIVSTLGSISPHASLHGTYLSWGGLKTILAACFLFAVTRTVLRRASDGQLLLSGAVLAGSLAAAYALLQAMGLDPFTWGNLSVTWESGTMVRPFGTMGHPNLLAGYLVMVVPLSGWFALQAWRSRQWRTLVVLLAGTGLMAGTILVTMSRGAWLALAGVLLVLILGWVAVKRSRQMWLVMGATGALGVIVVTGVLALVPALRTEVLARATRPGHAARWEVWQASIAIFRDHPLIGCGLDTFPLAFGRHRTPGYWNLEPGITPTRAHNEYLHTLATQGLLGVAGLVVLSVGLVQRSWNAWRQPAPEERTFAVAVTAAIVGFAIQNLFSFTVAGSGTLFLTLAAILSRSGESRPCLPGHSIRGGISKASLLAGLLLAAAAFAINFATPGTVDMVRSVASALILAGLGFAMVAALLRCTSTLPETPTVPLQPMPADGRRLASPSSRKHECPLSAVERMIRTVLHLVIWIAIAGLLIHGVVRPYRGGQAAGFAEHNLPGNPVEALRWFEQAAALAPEEQKYWVRQGMVAITAARSPAISLEERRSLLLRARSACERAIGMIDPDPAAHAQYAHALLELTGDGLDTPAATLAAFDRAIALDPANPWLLAQAGGAALKLHDLARLQFCLDSGLASYPKCRQLRMLAAFADFHRDRFADAECRLLELFPPEVDLRDYPDEDSEIHGMAVLAACHVKSHQLDRAIRLAKFAVARRPANPLARWTLAHALEMTGKHDDAVIQLQKLLELQPRNPAVRQALDCVRRQGTGVRTQESGVRGQGNGSR